MKMQFPFVLSPAITRGCMVAVLLLMAVPDGEAQWATNGSNINNTNSGNVGIGTTAPSQKLEVVGTVKATGLELQGGMLKSAYVTQVGNDALQNSGIGLSVNRLFGATTRYTVTPTGFHSGFESPLSWFVFDGLYNNPVELLQGVTGSYLIDFNPALGWTPNTTSGFLNSQGLLAISFSSGKIATTITVEFYWRSTSGTDEWATIYSTTNNTQQVVTIPVSNSGNYVKKVRYTFSSNATQVYLNELEWFPAREVSTDQFTSVLSHSPYVQDITSQEFLFRDTAFNSVSSIKNTGDAYFAANASGRVGIGTATPTARLEVNGNVSVTGNVTATGNIAAKYQDVAEWVPAQQIYPAGTVLVLDTERTNHVRAAADAYDMHVAGVVTDMPGVILGEAGEDKIKVATTGRVKVKVDASERPVRVGDLLVTGKRLGTAMVSEPIAISGRQFHQPGTILGKALEPLSEGEGEILVLLSLQ